MDLQLKDRTALVTAASKGIGRGIARALAREHCRVIVTSSNPDNVRETADAIRKETSTPVFAHVLDLASPADLDRSLKRIVEERGPIDILVANVPGPAVVEAASLTLDVVEAAVRTTLLSAIALCTSLLPAMIQRGFGRILHLASTTGKEPDEGMVLSNLCRAAVLAYGKTLSREVARHGITVNSILTGSVMTDRAMDLLGREARTAGVSVEEMVRQASKSIPVGRISTPEEFANAAVFLASPLASYVNGVSLAVDGGWMRSL